MVEEIPPPHLGWDECVEDMPASMKVVKMAQREIVKLSAHDAFAIEQQHEARRIAEEMKRKQSVQPRRTVANERYVQQAVEEEQERKRTRGRGM